MVTTLNFTRCQDVLWYYYTKRCANLDDLCNIYIFHIGIIIILSTTHGVNTLFPQSYPQVAFDKKNTSEKIVLRFCSKARPTKIHAYYTSRVMKSTIERHCKNLWQPVKTGKAGDCLIESKPTPNSHHAERTIMKRWEF